ncbi:MAG: cupin domain-containing protein [Oscillospiraceae bacterium]|nr:cupin domain-containing protein [Oscillospiraceae bacterium]
MNIGEKIKSLRIKMQMTQEDLANRVDLSKGFISQLERNLTSPSISTLVDILECLGTDLRNFFNEPIEEMVVYGKDDIFEKEDRQLRCVISWLIPNSQKNDMEPIMMTLEPGGASMVGDPHEGEEFGYVLSGHIYITLNGKRHKCKKGESFYFKPTSEHGISNPSKSEAVVLWVCTPPSF